MTAFSFHDGITHTAVKNTAHGNLKVISIQLTLCAVLLTLNFGRHLLTFRHIFSLSLSISCQVRRPSFKASMSSTTSPHLKRHFQG